MLYMIDAALSPAAMGDQRDDLLERELQGARELIDNGKLRAIWRKANGLGSFAVFDCDDHEELRELLTTRPFHPYFTSLRVTPLVAHPESPA
jgi:muconolactone delta-isomerase